jgi:hypothetical protein
MPKVEKVGTFFRLFSYLIYCVLHTYFTGFFMSAI